MRIKNYCFRRITTNKLVNVRTISMFDAKSKLIKFLKQQDKDSKIQHRNFQEYFVQERLIEIPF